MAADSPNAEEAPAFWCDAMLGGLARWLRAAGYDAAWLAGIDDAELVRQALASGRILLTADTGLARHGAIQCGRVRALLLPHGMGKFDQLHFVLGALGLRRREPRCMACGGLLHPIPRESARPEAPPRTYAWCEEFYRCARCAKLFWRGTHWRRIEARLQDL
ncbi:MAG: Mut7-C RNAse domain-containing protein [Planctomycetes bacterium]|nr:Mut7-C RNAse domain-containing protein [Planctomycetota bacterium]